MLVHQHRHHLNIYGEYVNCYVIVSLNIQFISRESQICQKRCIELIFKDKQQIPYNVFFFILFFCHIHCFERNYSQNGGVSR